MEIIHKITKEETSLKAALKTMEKGDIVKFPDGQAWKVLAKDDKVCKVWKCAAVADHVFNENESNEYKGSDIQKFLADGFEVPEEFQEMMDEKGCYLLTVDQILEYMPDPVDRMATDKSGYVTWWWTSTPNVSIGYIVRDVHPSGSISDSGADFSNGVAPACDLHLES